MSNGKTKQQFEVFRNIQNFINEIKTKDFIDDDVMKIAEGIGEELSGITDTKMRQYFDDIKGLRRKIKSGLTDQQLKVQLRLIQSRITYDVGRETKQEKKTNMQNLKKLIDVSVDKIMGSGNIETLTNNFITFFETMFGYFYWARKTKSKEGGEEE